MLNKTRILSLCEVFRVNMEKKANECVILEDNIDKFVSLYIDKHMDRLQKNEWSIKKENKRMIETYKRFLSMYNEKLKEIYSNKPLTIMNIINKG